MSGIAGRLCLRGPEIERAPLERMAAAIRWRGPDGLGVWSEGPVGLAHAHFWTTPEEVGEEQPVGSLDGALRLAADARIDNRPELLELLAGRGLELDPEASDAELILAAYRVFGEACLGQLVGDFAFALWDRERGRLLLARDPLGVRQLFYCLHDGVLGFGTTIGAVLAGLPRQPPLNRPLLEAFLAGTVRPWITQTPWSGLMRLPPAHRVSAGPEGIELALYYELGSGWRPAAPPADDEAWCRAFADRLEEAVSCRLRAVSPVGILGGGGVDSSAIACLADAGRQRRHQAPGLRLYGWTFERTPRADENAFLDLLASSLGRTEVTRVPSDELWALREWEDPGYPLDEPEVYLLRAQSLSLFRAAAGDGCRAVLVGEGANQALGHALYALPRSLRQVGWRHLGAELPHYRRWGRIGSAGLLARACLGPLLPEALRRALRARRSRTRRPEWLCAGGDGGGGLEPDLGPAFSSPAGLPPTGRLICAQLRGPFDLARYSALDVSAAHAGVEWRLPFLDRRLVDLLLHMPLRLLSWRGQDRVVLRRAMRGRMPEAIRTRRSKTVLRELIHRGLRGEERQRVLRLLDSPEAEAIGFVRAGPLHRELERYWRGEVNGYGLHRFLALEAWLRRQLEQGFSESRGA